MNLDPSGKLIFRIGQLAVQFAYLEDELLALAVDAEPLMQLPSKHSNWDDYYGASSFANRVDFLKAQLLDACDHLPTQLAAQNHRETIKRTLDQCQAAARRRNEILHSPSIEHSELGPIVQAKGRKPSQPMKPTTAQEVWTFVIELSTIQNHVRSLAYEIDWLIRATSSQGNARKRS